jgi:hypothetical protein
MTHIKETQHTSRIAYAVCINANTKARISCIVYDEQYGKYLHGRIDEQRVFKKSYACISTFMIFYSLLYLKFILRLKRVNG